MIRFTRHAKNKIRRLGLTDSYISEAVDNPDFKSTDSVGRSIFWKNVPNGRLKIVCDMEKEMTIVVTVILRKR